MFCLHSEQQSSIKSQLDVIQNEAEKLSSASANELKEMRDDIIVILNTLQDKEDNSSSSDEDETDNGEEQARVFKSLDDIMDRLSKLKDAIQVIPKETRLLQHLYFEDMFSREDSINDASKGTFAWIMMTDSEFEEYLSSWDAAVKPRFRNLDNATEKMNESRKLLRKWLTDGDGVFHISGKAGSGKSTFMKFILHHASTDEYLRQWVGTKSLVQASFYFWRSDRQKLQMSLEGLYRSILFGVLRKCPHLMPDVFPDQWRTMSLQAASMSFESDLFRPLKIKQAFEMLMQQPVRSDKFAFCFFIDGLDEYEAEAFEHKVLARHLRDWSIKSNIKMCVSSRPEIEFLDIFRQDLRINLHELTARDIRRSSQDMFEQDEAFPKVKGIYLELLDEVVNMAEGVFLWACLVVKSLLVEVGRDANSERLWQTLRGTPPKLDDVYDGMLNTLSRQDRKFVDYILLLVVTNPFWSMNAICLSWLFGAEDFRLPGPGSKYSDQEAIRQLESVRRQLQGLTKGLLNLAPDTGNLSTCPMFSRRVRFFHRTARDYLTTPERKSQLDASFPLFDAYQVHSMLRLAELSLINVWNVPEAFDLEIYALEMIELFDATNSPYQQPYSHMKILENIWALHFKQTISLQRFTRIEPYEHEFCQSNVSFLHIAAWHGQVDFVRQELDASNDRFVEAESRVGSKLDTPPPGRSNLLLSASCGVSDSEIVSLLLRRGCSSQSYVSLFDRMINKNVKVATVWVVFIAYLSGVSFRYDDITGDTRLKHLFGNLENFLLAADQVPVVLLGRNEGAKTDYMTHFTTVEQLVLLCQPPNIQELLTLLRRWRKGDEEEKVTVPWLSQWESFGVVDLPIYQTAENLGQFRLQGVASDREIITDLDNLGFRIW
jgi:hypothetical protein